MPSTDDTSPGTKYAIRLADDVRRVLRCLQGFDGFVFSRYVT